MSMLEAILFGIDLDSDPPSFEILLLAEHERDTCVAGVLFDLAVKAPGMRTAGVAALIYYFSALTEG